MLRWFVIPKNRFFNIYLHHILRSDDDRALHDHPWWNVSILLKGMYIEHVAERPDLWAQGYRRTTQKIRKAGFRGIVFRTAEAIHRIELYYNYVFADASPLHTLQGLPIKVTGIDTVWSLFITGPKIREWGFWCPKGWRLWTDYVSNADGVSSIGKGCDD